MKSLLRTVIVFALITAVSLPLAALAEDLSADQLKLLESNGIPLYPGATYTTGDNGDVMVMWFGTKDPPDKIIDWYKKNLPGWSEVTTNGTRVVYKGPKGLEPKDLQSRPYIFSRIIDESPGSAGSEITVRIPK